jgi:hypothetical protein
LIVVRPTERRSKSGLAWNISRSVGMLVVFPFTLDQRPQLA